ncbi:hypothetical protein KP509_39G022800 [Ceratopteris richardii]|uniref:Uncharacterized protein n=3 Tax=Ceratopteris richardii TaxID=49495 RepID=A0A8T2PYT2_CERRI|nr:hypothetical protein KP509_39G022800 [Ceratopteris richardii]
MGKLLINLSQQLLAQMKQVTENIRNEFQHKVDLLEADISPLQEELLVAKAENQSLQEQLKELQARIAEQEMVTRQRDAAVAELTKKEESLQNANAEISKMKQELHDKEDARIALGNLLEETRVQLDEVVQKGKEQYDLAMKTTEELQKCKIEFDEVNNILRRKLTLEAQLQKVITDLRRKRDAYSRTIQFQNQEIERRENQLDNQKERVRKMEKQVAEMKVYRDAALSNDFYLQEAFLQTQAEILLTEAIALSSVRVDAQLIEPDTLKQLLETLKKKIAGTFRLARNMYLDGIIEE